MMKMNKNKKGQAGFVITVELLLIVVILVMGLVTGWAKVRDQTLAELSDTGSAIGSIDQSYKVFGTVWFDQAATIAATASWAFNDATDTAGGTTNGVVGGDGQFIVYGTGLSINESGPRF